MNSNCKLDELEFYKSLYSLLSVGALVLIVCSILLFISIKIQFNKVIKVHALGDQSLKLNSLSRNQINLSRIRQVSNGATVKEINLNLAKFITNEDEENRKLVEFE
jgi:hypothetical protein